jgi:hypothetical protein
MKTLLKVIVITLVGLCFAPEVPAQDGRTVYVVCRKFVAEKNCHKCSDYFHARSEDEAKAKCGKVTVKPIILDPLVQLLGGCCPIAPATMIRAFANEC